MIIKNGKTISSSYKGSQVIDKIMKGTLVVYEAFKNLIASGVPLTLTKCKGKIIRLPNEYQEVEYIKSTGTQWLDTGFIPNQDTRVVCEYQYHTKFDCFTFGARKSVNNDAFCFMASGTNGGQMLTSYNDSGNVILYEAKDYTRHKVDKNKNLVYLDDVLVHTFPAGQTFTVGGELEIFATYNGGTKGYLPSNLKMYYFKLYDNDVLIRDLVPCYRKNDNVVGMYDLVNGVFYTNQGTGQFEKGKDVGVFLIDYKIYGNSKQESKNTHNLPSEYQEVEYLENKRLTNDKSSYINTGVVPNANTGVDIVYQALDYTNSQYILGVRENTINYAINGSLSRTDWDIRFNGTPTYSDIERTSDKWQSKITMTNGTGTWELTNLDVGTYKKISFTGKTVQATMPLGLFCYYATNPETYAHNGLRVYSCKIYDGETLVRDFIPCYRKSDAIAGMYDLVNNTFYTSEGTEDFTIEKTIPSQDTPIEVESVGEYDETTGKYKIPVKVSGTNIFDGLLQLGDYTGGTYRVSSVNYILVKPNTTYRFSRNNERVYQYDENYTQIKRDDTGNNGNTITTLSNCKYIRCVWFSETDTTKIFWINEGTELLPYEPYQEPITTNINLNEPLRKVGNYADYVDYENKKVVRKVGVKTFDGSETWVKHTTTNGGYGVYRNENLLTPLINAPLNATFMTHFSLTYKAETIAFILNEYRFSWNSNQNIGSSRIYMSAKETTAEEFINWLANNKPSLYYPIATPTEETIELPNIPTFKGTTILSVDTTIQPSNMEVVYKGKR